MLAERGACERFRCDVDEVFIRVRLFDDDDAVDDHGVARGDPL